MARHFKAMEPLTPEFRDTLDLFSDALWTCYEKLNQYKRAPRRKDKARPGRRRPISSLA
jgi:hypothetical protein